MTKLKTIENKVREILENNPEARDDDMKLYLLVCRECMNETHGRADFSFDEVMTNYNALGCPPFESVRRTRQKIQAETPQLACSPKARRKRSKGVDAYAAYALDKEG